MTLLDATSIVHSFEDDDAAAFYAPPAHTGSRSPHRGAMFCR